MPDGSPPFTLSVIVRTQGRRPTMLVEALGSLAEQTDDRFEVILVEHDGPGTAITQQAVPPALASRTTVVGVRGGGRAAPLNRGLEVATGSHVAFLDDDDLARRDWVSTFRHGAGPAGSRVIRAVTADLPVVSIPDEPGYRVAGVETVPDERQTFDLVAHLAANATPICAFAAPLGPVRDLGLRFAEDLSVLEDFGFFMEAALRLGVYDTGRVTSIYRRWAAAEASWDSVDRQVWLDARAKVIERLADLEGVAPAGTIRSIATLHREVEELRGRLADLTHQAAVDRSSSRAEIQRLERDMRAATRRADTMSRSLSWRLTAPLRAFRSRVSGFRRGPT